MDPGDLQVWLNHFEYHSQGAHRTPADASDLLEPDERRLIARSIATFQLGEQAQGKTLMRVAGQFARANRILVLERIMQLFLAEEQHHAALLKAFMEDHRIPVKTADWTDRVFRCVRRLAGLELYLHVFICAELIGNVYYRALESVTRCQRLRVLCRTLVADELAHVGFESQLLLSLRARRASTMRAIIRLAHRTFFVGAAGVVWSTHRPVLRRAGYSVGSFLRACLAQYEFYLEPPLRASRSESSRSCNLSSSPLSLRASSLISISASRLTSKSSSPRSRSRVFWRF
jgi:hypothetical protein